MARFTTLIFSETYLNLVHKIRDEILSKEFFEAFSRQRGRFIQKIIVLNAFMDVIATKGIVFQPV
ncbi:hypothetical protein HH214_18900 [Mucilaginibacter robiniae]|uniref:Uncharacterized protein n=1 Tax=Mucilaginibacter robiniae TaxID=2728022 RepID=A0A7L5EBL3_9SPHI|nr:hypothetical protein HH214_18900 [Mucilaginibacter robiniae]